MYGQSYSPCLSTTVISQQCYRQPNCTGDQFEVSSARQCCVRRDDGMSYEDDSGTCIISQCIGNWDASTKYWSH